jgi:hypothetical protein
MLVALAQPRNNIAHSVNNVALCQNLLMALLVMFLAQRSTFGAESIIVQTAEHTLL